MVKYLNLKMQRIHQQNLTLCRSKSTWQLMSAFPCITSTFTTASCPRIQARWRGVRFRVGQKKIKGKQMRHRGYTAISPQSFTSKIKCTNLPAFRPGSQICLVAITDTWPCLHGPPWQQREERSPVRDFQPNQHIDEALYLLIKIFHYLFLVCRDP